MAHPQTNTPERQTLFEQEPTQAEFERPVNPSEALAPQATAQEVVGEPVDVWITDEFVNEFEKAITRHKRMISAILRLTNPTHWVNMGKDKFYLQDPGCLALMRPLGIRYKPPEVRLELHRVDLIERLVLNNPGQETLKHLKPLNYAAGEWYAFWIEGEMHSTQLQQSGWFIGYADSKDQFFNARRDWSPEHGEADIKKSAMSNWEVRGVTGLAGIRSPDPEMLKAAGLDLSRIQGVNYSGQKTAEEGGKLISEPQTKRLFGIAKSKNISTDLLRAYLKECYGYDRSDQVPVSKYEEIVKGIEAGQEAVQNRIEQTQARKAPPQEPTTTEREPGGDDA